MDGYRKELIGMTVQTMQLKNRNELVTRYLRGELKEFFAYDAFDQVDERYHDLQERSYPREELVSVLTSMNDHWDAPQATLSQIKRLKDERSVVVVGGQQAGLLTGPLYTIHKIVSILKYAKEQERRLKVPVIPLFWIAGEDHDYDEINHTYTATKGKINKRIFQQEVWLRQPISDISLDQDLAYNWIKEIFADLHETVHTKELVRTLFEQIDQSKTFVDFFARLIFQLFPEEGLVLIDSHDAKLRHLEKEFFCRLIEKQGELNDAFYTAGEKIKQKGLGLQVEITKEDGNLFYHDDAGERVLLIRDGEDWIGKNEEVKLSQEQLLEIAKEKPERLSNNVLTRPLMQEALLPTLAFIAGDGEISYWAVLKEAFPIFDEKMLMPPVVPRLSITLLTERIDKILKTRVLDADFIVNHGCQQLKLNWLSTQENPPLQLLFDEAKEEMKELHEPLQVLAASLGPDLEAESKRNLANILREVDYLKRRTQKQLEKKYKEQLTMYEEVQVALRPEDTLQERILNILPFINMYGVSVIHTLLEQDLSFKEDHHIVYLHK